MNLIKGLRGHHGSDWPFLKLPPSTTHGLTPHEPRNKSQALVGAAECRMRWIEATKVLRFRLVSRQI
ncbi:hypothetical protein ACFX12_011907 [Malus domestica]